jgi:hypothetical protein
LLFQVCLFFFVQRISGWRPAVVAIAFPLLTISFFYSAQGRPYGLLLGAYALAMVCWQGATRNVGTRRLASLVGLAFALALGITSHYFGLLILIPVCAGELIRTLQQRRLDWGVLAAIGVGMASILTVLPFEKAVSVYRQHYYLTEVPLRIIPEAYPALLVAPHSLPVRENHLVLLALLVCAVLVCVALARRLRRGARTEPLHEWAALAALVLLPVFGYLLGRFVTHAVDVRYMIATLFAVAAFCAIALDRFLQRTVVFYVIAALMFYAGVKSVHRYILNSRGGGAWQMARFPLSPEVLAALNKDPQRRIYMQGLGDYYFDEFYEADPALRARLSFVYSQDEEIRWVGHDTNYITALNMQHFAPLPVASYETLLAEGDPLVLNCPGSWDWMGKDLDSKHVPRTDYGSALGCDLVQLHLGKGD